jgi:hypothetical protein
MKSKNSGSYFSVLSAIIIFIIVLGCNRNSEVNLMNRFASVSGDSFRDNQLPNGLSTHEIAIEPVEGAIYVYATIQMGSANPVEYINNMPCWRPQKGETIDNIKHGIYGQGELAPALGGFVPDQKWGGLPEDLPQFLQIIELGMEVKGRFISLLRFGLADDRRGLGRGTSQAWYWDGSDNDVPGRNRAHVCAWVCNGTIDYFGPFVRPNTPYDFKLLLDMKQLRMTAWVSGRGDDDWFLLAENSALPAGISRIDRVRTSTYPDAPQIEKLLVRSSPWAEGETLQPHPLAKLEHVVSKGKGFTFQSMRSTWLKPGKHVTIFRKPGVHAGFPDVAQAGQDRLVCVWRNGSHTGGKGGLSLAYSNDLGKTWSEDSLFTELKVNCPRLQRLKDGSILLIADKASGGNQYVARWDYVMWSSSNGGHNWTGEQWLRTAKAGGPGGPVHSRILELSDGSWILSASSFTKLSDGRTAEKLEFYRSLDRSQTWSYWSGPLAYPPFCLSEPSTLEIDPGHLIVYARESRSDGMPGVKGYSSDYGKTWQYHDLPFPITGRTCAGFLKDGRVMVTFRSGVGRAALWAWIGDVKDSSGIQPVGGHFNDRHSVGLKDGALHIDNDGVCGQFTKYNLRPPDTEHSTLELTFEVQVLANAGRAASISVPFAGILRLFPDHVIMAHDSTLRAEIIPGQFHTYHIISRLGSFELSIDGKRIWDTDKGDQSLQSLSWTKISSYALAFGNETQTFYETFGYTYWRNIKGIPDIYPVNIPEDVTGYSIWRRVEAVTEDPDPKAGRHVISWDARRDGFPDQYQLDHIIEVEACVSGHENGYSGWVQLDDGRIFVVNYTDDTAAACVANPHMLGVPWIRGTFLDAEDLPDI